MDTKKTIVEKPSHFSPPAYSLKKTRSDNNLPLSSKTTYFPGSLQKNNPIAIDETTIGKLNSDLIIQIMDKDKKFKPITINFNLSTSKSIANIDQGLLIISFKNKQSPLMPKINQDNWREVLLEKIKIGLNLDTYFTCKMAPDIETAKANTIEWAINDKNILPNNEISKLKISEFSKLAALSNASDKAQTSTHLTKLITWLFCRDDLLDNQDSEISMDPSKVKKMNINQINTLKNKHYPNVESLMRG